MSEVERWPQHDVIHKGSNLSVQQSCSKGCGTTIGKNHQLHDQELAEQELNPVLRF
jgi:hypothetical protein